MADILDRVTGTGRGRVTGTGRGRVTCVGVGTLEGANVVIDVCVDENGICVGAGSCELRREIKSVGVLLLVLTEEVS